MIKLIVCMLLIQGILSADSKKSEILELIQVNDKVWAIVGPLTGRTAKNLANNASFGFVVTSQGIVLIDSGGSLKGAKEIHRLIKSVSSKAIKFVINTGVQDHRWLGNDYFKKQGAQIIASKKAVKGQGKYFDNQYAKLHYLLKEENIKGTLAYYAQTVFSKHHSFTLGNTSFELYFEGGGHTMGDIFVHLPKEKIIFSGDIVYTQRLLSIGANSNTQEWLNSFETLARLKPDIIIPGHGKPTTLKKATKETYDYLIYLRTQAEELDDIADTKKIDQSQFSHLYNYKALKDKNAQRVFIEMQWE
ncbi:MBL fold metallo-hydrolase [Sulfurimonas sp. MAG313]|nr:MBL fold metallo-hydrolase [Sulfurimonas sp. MAG313]MDF1880722.1 MBL fold metallo-hydrolase [Sulfurimonas sp. MAG313]